MNTINAKKEARIIFACTEQEKEEWLVAFGPRELCRKIRELLTKEVERKKAKKLIYPTT